jgi:hypothetical protein
VSESRLAELPDGRIGYALKRRHRDGMTAVVMTNAVLTERLCALAPSPRRRLVTCHGALPPAAAMVRAMVGSARLRVRTTGQRRRRRRLRPLVASKRNAAPVHACGGHTQCH